MHESSIEFISQISHSVVTMVVNVGDGASEDWVGWDQICCFNFFF